MDSDFFLFPPNELICIDCNTSVTIAFIFNFLFQLCLTCSLSVIVLLIFFFPL